MDNHEEMVVGSASRRDFIKRSAIAGTVVWATPAILSLRGAGAGAASTAPVPCATCNDSAYGLRVQGTVLGIPTNLTFSSAPPDTCIVNVNAGVVTATDVCGRTGGDSKRCTAAADVQTLNIGLPGANVSASAIVSRAAWVCDCSTGPTGTASIANLVVNGNAVNVSTAPNTVINVINTALIKVIVTVNRQSCIGGVFSVDALVIQVILTPLIGLTTNLTVTIAHAQVSNGCAC